MRSGNPRNFDTNLRLISRAERVAASPHKCVSSQFDLEAGRYVRTYVHILDAKIPPAIFSRPKLASRQLALFLYLSV